MPVKTAKYYARTVVLKSAAIGCYWLEKTHLLDEYKRSNHHYFSRLFDENFEENIVEKNAPFSPLYLTYCHFRHPDELGKHLRFDEGGVAMCRKDTVPAFYNPFFAAYYSLNCYNHYVQTKDFTSLKNFWKQVHFLEQHGTVEGDCLWFHYHFDSQKLSLKSPWASGLTQAAIMSVFIRATHFEGVEKYGRLVEMTFRSLFVLVEKGGVFRMLSNGDPWIEEYPSPQPDLTLNGFVFCIIGLYEYFHWKGKTEAVASQIRPIIRTLFYRLHEFVFGKYTRYHSRSGVFHNIEYQGLYVCLFLHLHQLSGKNAFLELAHRFDRNTAWEAFYEFYGLSDSSKELVKIYFDEQSPT